MLDEPTRGVDVGAKRDIYFLIQRLAREGHGVIVISSELMELVGLCHRVAVMRAGRLQATVDAEHLTEEELISHATGTASARLARAAAPALHAGRRWLAAARLRAGRSDWCCCASPAPCSTAISRRWTTR